MNDVWMGGWMDESLMVLSHKHQPKLDMGTNKTNVVDSSFMSFLYMKSG